MKFSPHSRFPQIQKEIDALLSKVSVRATHLAGGASIFIRMSHLQYALASDGLAQGKRHEARDLLAQSNYEFTEGVGTPMLNEAKALLNDLPS